MVKGRVRAIRNADLSKVIDICVTSLSMNRDEARGVLDWASRSDSAAEVFVTETDGVVIGFLVLEWPGTGWNRVAEIGLIAVVTKHRRKGFGSHFMTTMEQFAKGKGLRKIYVEPSVENEVAIQFYIKNEYRPEAIRKDWYKDEEDSIILGKHL